MFPVPQFSLLKRPAHPQASSPVAPKFSAKPEDPASGDSFSPKATGNADNSDASIPPVYLKTILTWQEAQAKVQEILSWKASGQLSSALNELKAVPYAPALVEAGDVHMLSGRPDLAFEAYKEAARLAPDSPVPEMAMGDALRLTGRGGEAKAHYERAIALDPTFYKADLALGRVHESEKSFDIANSLYHTAMLRKAPVEVVYNHLGLLNQHWGRDRLASRFFQEALNHAPNNLGVHQNNFAAALINIKEFSYAKKQLQACAGKLGDALKEAPSRTDLKLNLAIAYWNRSVLHAKQAEQNPSNSYMRGLEMEDSQMYATRAVLIDPRVLALSQAQEKNSPLFIRVGLSELERSLQT